jgi:hypothetical protein
MHVASRPRAQITKNATGVEQIGRATYFDELVAIALLLNRSNAGTMSGTAAISSPYSYQKRF